jgi:hypothetical protein
MACGSLTKWLSRTHAINFGHFAHSLSIQSPEYGAAARHIPHATAMLAT